MADSFPLGLWLWSLAPYLVAGLLLWVWRVPCAALGALILTAPVDAATFCGVFIEPQGSTAAVGLFAAPLWNLAVFMPTGAITGWWVCRRRDRSR